MSFQEIIGQAKIKEHLVEMVLQNRLSHALLFLGPEGSGSLSLAISFAQYIVCERNSIQQNNEPSLFSNAIIDPAKPTRFADSCGICSACIKSQKLIHPDIHFSYPVIPKKPGDKPVSIDYGSEWREFILQYP